MTKTLLSDSEIINAFQLRNTGKNTYQATFAPFSNPRAYLSECTELLFTANSKEEATRIAREYGTRILSMKMIYVYRHRG